MKVFFCIFFSLYITFSEAKWKREDKVYPEKEEKKTKKKKTDGDL